MKLPNGVPTDLELEILKIIWRRGDATVREVFEDLANGRQVAYTTVLTMMGVLERKGFVGRTPGDRAYLYRTIHSERQVLDGMLKEFTDRVFSGSVECLVAHLVGNPEVSPEEISRIQALLCGQ
ncbi:MAG: BlaI/MecI/CopY family transcriptional regulator [Bryobacterales bacterium]|nr:BlaI/MecI/CopY family transcriptional regulator [Bryobacterales bacterium]